MRNNGEEDTNSSFSPVEVTEQQVLVLSGKLETAFRLNIQDRLKFAGIYMCFLLFLDKPTLFLKSELDLFAVVNQLYQIPSYPELYIAVIKCKIINVLVDLLLHENQDIVIKVVDLFRELFDVDENDPKTFKFYSKLLSSFSKPERGGIESLVGNMENQIARLRNKTLKRDELDQIGSIIFSSCLLIQELFSFNSVLVQYFLTRTDLSKFLIGCFIDPITKTLLVTCLPLMSNIFLFCCQNSSEFCEILGTESFKEKTYLDQILIVLSTYIVSDYNSSDSEEFGENLLESLVTALSYTKVQGEFKALEGPELILKLIKSRHICYVSALKCLKAFALHNTSGCKQLVKIGMLKILFPLFMSKGIKRKRSTKRYVSKLLLDKNEVELLVGDIFYQCFILFSEQDIELGRLAFKFKEKQYLKCDRLIELLKTLVVNFTKSEEEAKDIAIVEIEILQSSNNLSKEQAKYLLQLNSGFEGIEQICFIIGKLVCMEQAFYLHFKQALKTDKDILLDYDLTHIGILLERKAKFLSSSGSKEVMLSVDENRAVIVNSLLSVATILKKEKEWSKT